MNVDHERYVEWDAAYLCGALTAAERIEYESHLSHCARCRTAISEIAPVLGFLSRVSADRVESLGRERAIESPDREHRARVLALGTSRRRRRRAWTVGIAAAAAIVIAVIAVPVTESILRPPVTSIALEQVVDVPLTASVQLSDVAWGTRIEMTCEYDSTPERSAEGWIYALVVVDTSGAETTLSTWRAQAGRTAQLSAGTALTTSEISAIEIRSVATDAVLMRSVRDELPFE